MKRRQVLQVVGAMAAAAVAGCRKATTAALPSGAWRIDVHMHLQGRYRSPRGPGQDYLAAADHLVRQMDQLGVRRAIVLPPPQIDGQRHAPGLAELAPAVKRHPQRLVLAAGGQLLNPLLHRALPGGKPTTTQRREFEDRVNQVLSAGAKAFGELSALHLSFNPRHGFSQTSPDHPFYLALADQAALRGIPIDLHMEAIPRAMALPAGFARVSPNNPSRLAANLTALERLLAHNRKARVVWQHIGWDNTGNMNTGLCRRLLKAHGNLFMALRVEERLFDMAGKPMPNRIVDENWRVRKDWLDLFNAFSDRFVVGSDEFIGVRGKRQHRFPQSFEETWGAIGQLPSKLQRAIGRDNALRIYPLAAS